MIVPYEMIDFFFNKKFMINSDVWLLIKNLNFKWIESMIIIHAIAIEAFQILVMTWSSCLYNV